MCELFSTLSKPSARKAGFRCLTMTATISATIAKLVTWSSKIFTYVPSPTSAHQKYLHIGKEIRISVLCDKGQYLLPRSNGVETEELEIAVVISEQKVLDCAYSKKHQKEQQWQSIRSKVWAQKLHTCTQKKNYLNISEEGLLTISLGRALTMTLNRFSLFRFDARTHKHYLQRTCTPFSPKFHC